ncbi:hypothetical protein CTI12_AA193120 [Artemisia annua]|uniref:Uncharacterized protein n=1 Tax=Artemisia annua TaxID=35608 RepID=A0A2U1MCL7_ARTAN|nr:hypothetical protein CTI12_AA193120 [Artemisia annua]
MGSLLIDVDVYSWNQYGLIVQKPRTMKRLLGLVEIKENLVLHRIEQETVTGTVLEAMDRELEEISANNYTLKCVNQESQARERARDQTIETTSAMIQELQRRIDETSGKP